MIKQKFLKPSITIVLLIVTSSILNGCGEERLSKLSHSDSILAFGDSLTIGVGASQQNSYPSVLEMLTGLTVINAGISGETTAEGLLRIDQTLESSKPALVILLEGGNDIIQNISSTNTKNNLDQMIKLANQSGAQVILVGVPEKNLFSSVHPLYRELAELHDVILIDDTISSLLKKSKYKSDAVHFNADGYRILAETIYETLQDNGAL